MNRDRQRDSIVELIVYELGHAEPIRVVAVGTEAAGRDLVARDYGVRVWERSTATGDLVAYGACHDYAIVTSY